MASAITEWLTGMSGEEAFTAANGIFHEKKGLCSDSEEALAKNSAEIKFEGLFVEHEDDEAMNNNREEVFFCSGRKHGLYRTFTADCKGGKEFQRLGSFDRGVRSGAEWRRLSGDCFLVLTLRGASTVDENNNDETAAGAGLRASFRGVYLYPDLTHAIAGTFLEDGRLQSGHFGAVAAIYCDNGVLVPSVELARCEGASCSYDPSTAFRISKTPFTRDLYEQQIVYVAQSRYDVHWLPQCSQHYHIHNFTNQKENISEIVLGNT